MVPRGASGVVDVEEVVTERVMGGLSGLDGKRSDFALPLVKESEAYREKVLRDSVEIVDYVRRRYEEIVMLVDNIGVNECIVTGKLVGYNLRDVVSVVDEVRRGAVKRVGDVRLLG